MAPLQGWTTFGGTGGHQPSWMASRSDPPWLWVGLGVLTFIVVRTATNQLQQVSEDPKDEGENARSRMINQKTEDALSLETLRRLTDSPNRDIKLATVGVIRDRVVFGPAYDLLLRDVASSDEEIRARGLLALRYICTTTSYDRGYPYATYATYDAVITALVNMMHAPWHSDGSPRPPQEQNALWIIGYLGAINLSIGLKAGVVRRWLAYFPFGLTDAERRETVAKLLWSPSTDIMTSILRQIQGNPKGEMELKAVGLLPGDEEVNQPEGDQDAEQDSPSGPTRRRETLEDHIIRRRRREAVVVSDGAQPLGESDIIQMLAPI
ncbi:MAG: hypothetical protein M1823_001387 [Watsoniomyces obsoletus]|nr:MAG: hypothetical protein M1823_001387 [Watsoniomyces obsoletus]